MAELTANGRLERARERAGERAWQAAFARLQREVEAFLRVEMEPPQERAGFYHNYFCPEHAVELRFDPARPRVHICPVDGRAFSGEPYDAAWRWFVNNRLSSMAYTLALQWRLQGDGRCRARAEQILLGYARRYREYEPGPQTPYGRGRATFQSLDEAVWLIPLARSCDLLGESLGAPARRSIEEDLLRPAGEHILAEKYWRIHNIECWHNAALAAAGACLGEEAWVRTAIEEDFGFHHQLREGVRADGLWWEGSSSYHFYALAALSVLAQMREPLWEAERLQRMFRAPVELALPDGRLPATNDCWFSSSLVGQVCHGVMPAAAFYELAWGAYGEPLFAQVLVQNYREGGRDSLEALLYGEALPETGDVDPPRAALCRPSGLACLRSQAGDYLLLKCGPHGGSHGHPDKLALSLCARGFPLSPDLGTPGYGIPLNDSWYRQTLSHNTVLVDGRSQPPAEGEVVAFEQGEGFHRLEARAVWGEGLYEGVRMQRALLWTEQYFVDFFQVECSSERQIDWVLRVKGEAADRVGGCGVELHGDGYAHISGAHLVDAEAETALQWTFPAGRFALFLPCEKDTQLISGKVPHNPAAEQSEILVRRRRARHARFIALAHAWEGDPFVRGVRMLDGGGLRVETGEGVHLWVAGGEARAEPGAARVFRWTGPGGVP